MAAGPLRLPNSFRHSASLGLGSREMLEKPDLAEDLILERVREEFGLPASQVIFLPLGYDLNTAVYRLAGQDGRGYFLKLRKGDFNEISVALPKYLKACGVPAIIPPLETRSRQLWGSLGDYKMILYPFVQGVNGYEIRLTDRQWLDFGAALRSIHSVSLPPELRRMLAQETFDPLGRETVRQLQAQAEMQDFNDPVAAKLAAFMRIKRAEISQVVERAERLAHLLQAKTPELVLCHSDIHPGNLLIAEDGGLYIVDWDNPLLAPRERDLALIGGCRAWSDPQQARFFYQGYGEAQVDQAGLAYFRYERIVQDMAEFCKQLLLTGEGGDDREQSYQYFASNFTPGGEIELAGKSDPRGMS